MTVPRERFVQGMTYDEYKQQMTRNRERLEQNEEGVKITDENLAPFRAVPRPLKVMVLTEDWCGDAIANVPVLARLARESGKLEMRLFLRDQNDDLMQQYMNGQFRSIPVFAFFDENFHEVGRFIERPASVTAERQKRRARIYASDPAFGSPDAPIADLPEDVRARLSEKLQAMRDEMKDLSDREVIRELAEIVRRRT
ncbi:MAG: thioredoxin family protein [Candidatus Limnocylindria bacterium]